MKSTPYFLYILRCKNNSLYTGIAIDIEKRLKMHSEGKGSKYVWANRPFELVYFEKQSNKSKAMKREIEVKSLKKKEKELLIEGGLNKD